MERECRIRAVLMDAAFIAVLCTSLSIPRCSIANDGVTKGETEWNEQTNVVQRHGAREKKEGQREKGAVH